MTTRLRNAIRLLPALVLFAWLVTAQAVDAQDAAANLNLLAVETATAGSTIEIVAELSGPDGLPIGGQAVEFSLSVEFLNNFDDVVIGNAITDESGIARIEFEPRSEGDHTIVARANTKNGQTLASGSSQLAVTSGDQLYRELSPVRIPGANVWMVSIVLLVVWSVFLLIAIRIWQISRLGGSTGDRADA